MRITHRQRFLTPPSRTAASAAASAAVRARRTVATGSSRGACRDHAFFRPPGDCGQRVGLVSTEIDHPPAQRPISRRPGVRHPGVEHRPRPRQLEPTRGRPALRRRLLRPGPLEHLQRGPHGHGGRAGVPRRGHGRHGAELSPPDARGQHVRNRIDGLLPARLRHDLLRGHSGAPARAYPRRLGLPRRQVPGADLHGLLEPQPVPAGRVQLPSPT